MEIGGNLNAYIAKRGTGMVSNIWRETGQGYFFLLKIVVVFPLLLTENMMDDKWDLFIWKCRNVVTARSENFCMKS